MVNLNINQFIQFSVRNSYAKVAYCTIVLVSDHRHFVLKHQTSIFKDLPKALVVCSLSCW